MSRSCIDFVLAKDNMALVEKFLDHGISITADSRFFMWGKHVNWKALKSLQLPNADSSLYDCSDRMRAVLSKGNKIL